jgi:predicted NUDIX family NTP pyrophosphohydrolase
MGKSSSSPKKKQSAGILLYRLHDDAIEVFLVHPGGPFWVKKDLGAWSVPKGEFDGAENALDAAIRELEEETGIRVDGDFLALTPIMQKSGKKVFAWALEKDINVAGIKSNEFEIEWPPKSGKIKSFPEVDKAAWFNLTEAKQKINNAQVGLLLELETKIKGSHS